MDIKKMEIERLAGEYEDAKARYEMLGMMNTPSDPGERRASGIVFALAKNSMLIARDALNRAMYPD